MSRCARSWARPWSLLVVIVAGLVFWLPALHRAGVWPAPLDDVYIYYGFARATALGSPMSWMPGNGYSSGATSVLYPMLLAPWWALGLRGSWLGIGAAVLAVLALFDMSLSLAKLCHARARALAFLAPLMIVAVPLLDWSWFSGMETAVLGAAVGRALLACQRALDAPPAARARAQLIAGAWLALLPLTRPETIVLSLSLAIAVVHGARSLSTWSSLARALLPQLALVAAQAMLNHALTGEWQAAGAVRKLYSSAPFTSGEAIAVEVIKNLVVLVHQALWRALGGSAGVAAHGLLTVIALLASGRRRLAVSLVMGACGSLLLVCFNSTARFQNYRYAAPSLAMLVCASSLGLAAIAARRSTGRTALAVGLAAMSMLATRREWPRQVGHFGQASVNIVSQQGEVARRLAVLVPRPRRVLVGDAGAIPYLSELPAIDGLGLGGLGRMPFARASLHGTPAVVELIERLAPRERPDVFALYPAWWSGLADRFGTAVDSVHIEHNVICAADEKIIYRADWSDLSQSDDATEGASDRLDVADLIDEVHHDIRMSSRHGKVIAATRMLADGTHRWDGGRALGADGELSFVSKVSGSFTLIVRTDAAIAGSEIIVNGTRAGTIEATPLDGNHWLEATHAIEVAAGDRIGLRVRSGELRLFQIRLVRR
jgi:hypothetical protein